MKLLIPPPIVALITGVLIWGGNAIAPQWQITFPFQVPIAASLIAIGLMLDITSILAFRRVKTTVTPLAPEKASSLVIGGLYKFTRNPMYLGLLLILSGVCILIGNPAGVVALIGFVAYINAFQIKPEERLLEQNFGAEYLRYQQTVRRWL